MYMQHIITNNLINSYRDKFLIKSYGDQLAIWPTVVMGHISTKYYKITCGPVLLMEYIAAAKKHINVAVKDKLA